ncbi:MAG: [Fe-S]-binding protein [Planctomycetota bacterium]
MSNRTTLPKWFLVEQTLPRNALSDVGASVSQGWRDSALPATLQAGQRVGVAVGSRGISNLASIVRHTLAVIRETGATPIIIPAMGSHGGGTAAGQRAVLEKLGITPESMGCPVEADMATHRLPIVDSSRDDRFPTPMPTSQAAASVDHLILVNRIKPHTRITGTIQSGLIKMSLVGLGKHPGAEWMHQQLAAAGYRLDTWCEPAWRAVQQHHPLRFGLAILEDAHKQTSHVEVLSSQTIWDREPELLRLADEMMPRIPFPTLDLLIVDELGKEISGTGMDAYVIGRKTNDKQPGPQEWPKIAHIYARSLTHATNGNATGIGIAELCHQDVVDAMDPSVTAINSIAGDHITAGATPVTFGCDRDALTTSLRLGASRDPGLVKWVRIVNTLRLDRFWCSEGLWNDVEKQSDLNALCEPEPIAFDQAGNLVADSPVPIDSA